ncbi:MAG: efflux RND transporter periplasmic adaptor subunit [Patescibacteria group bacterium]|jgi:RND family efflux transporter MFP subunit|nr:efflux RND transporter periplasmic adaptor subunit [Patescibacteria group bacterium]
MKPILKKIFSKKIIIPVVASALVGFGSWYAWQYFKGESDITVQYVAAAAEKGTISVAVSGTGQVAVSNQVEIKPEASGKVLYLGVVNGQEVKSGELIAQLDNVSALKSIRDAQANLESAKISLEKLTAPADELEVAKAQNNLEQAKENKLEIAENLALSYENGFNDVANVFLDLPSLMAGLDGVIFGNDFSNDQWNIDYYKTLAKRYVGNGQEYKVDEYVDKAIASYDKARQEYEQNFEDYKNSSRYSNNEEIEALILQTYNTIKDVSESVKNMKNLIDFFEDTLTSKDVQVPGATATHQNNLESYTSKVNSHISSILSAKNSIINYQKDIVDADRTIAEQEGTLAELLAGTDELDIKSQKLAIKQKENSLLDARQELADYYVRAPFDGVLAEVNVSKGDTVSSGTTVATLITTTKLAEITLNEIDAAKVKLGQRAILEFDAIDNLMITGEVAEVDTLGTVASGVVSYGIKIGFDVQDDRIKPGMTLSANIIVDSSQDVLMVPLSAVKTVGNSSYVEVLVDSQPQRVAVTTGLSNDTMIEIVDGLTEGDQVITQTIGGSSGVTSSSNSNSNSSNNDAMRSMMQLNGATGPPR